MSHTKKGDNTMQVVRIGLDIAKSSFRVHGVDAHGKVVIRKQLSRSKVLPYFAQLPPCLIGLDACGGAHYWARELQKLGHDVRVMAVAMIQPYQTNQKNDQNDAEAIGEAVSRPRTRCVPVKTEAQQAVLTVQRARELLVTERIALANQIRGLLMEEEKKGSGLDLSLSHHKADKERVAEASGGYQEKSHDSRLGSYQRPLA